MVAVQVRRTRPATVLQEKRERERVNRTSIQDPQKNERRGEQREIKILDE